MSVVLKLYEELDDALTAARTLLDAHRRFHEKVGCPGLPDCYVCELEARSPPTETPDAPR